MTAPVAPSPSGSYEPPRRSSSVPAPVSTTADWRSVAVQVAIVLAIVVPIGTSLYFSMSGAADRRIDIVTTASSVLVSAPASPDSFPPPSVAASWTLTGSVLVDGEPIRARISVVASDPQGNRYAPRPVLTDSLGHFEVANIPVRLARDTVAAPISEVTITARGREPGADSARRIGGSETLRLSSHARTRWVQLPPFVLLTVFVVFLMSIAIGLLQVGKLGARKVQYYGSITLALLLTGAVVTFISIGLRHVNSTGTQGDVIALGFANIYKGTYVKDLSPEWLFSLTTPWQPVAASGGAATTPQLARGFGVPLWALLIAVAGAGLFTIRLVVKQILQPVHFQRDEDFRPRLQEVVLHQFYILFAPVGAVFVYQFLVLAGMASVETTVAVAMLAAGVVLNSVLDRALREAHKAVRGDEE